MKMFPTRRQWSRWALPTKIGILVGLMGLALSIALRFLPYREKTHRIAIVDVLSDVDLHLGDNIYPARYGTTHNPLNQRIYPQGMRGIVYLDKKDGSFSSDFDNPTVVGSMLVNHVKGRIEGIDLSCYRWVKAFSPEDQGYHKIVEQYRDSDSFFLLGPTALVAEDKDWGNFYERYAAIGIGQRINLLSEMERQGLSRASDHIEISVIFNMYHGGIRLGQKENFILQFNDFIMVVPSKTRHMRDAQELKVNIPRKHVNLGEGNFLFLYVLPWIEDKPILHKDGEVIKTAHFRDVGITRLQVKVEEEI